MKAQYLPTKGKVLEKKQHKTNASQRRAGDPHPGGQVRPDPAGEGDRSTQAERSFWDEPPRVVLLYRRHHRHVFFLNSEIHIKCEDLKFGKRAYVWTK